MLPASRTRTLVGLAAAPVIEGRDRNDEPVAGAVVTFAIRGGRASFNGPRLLRVITNAVRRTSVASLTSTGSGTLQVGVSAAFQGDFERASSYGAMVPHWDEIAP